MKRLALLYMSLGLLLLARPSLGQIIPVADQRQLHAHATFVGVTQYLEAFPTAPFAFFNDFVGPFVPNPDPEGPGSCEAAAFQVSQFTGGGISGSGATSGSWNTLPDGSYGGLSLARFKFHVGNTINYQLDVWVEPGDFVGSGEFLLETVPSYFAYFQTYSGEIHVTGRLSPGDYAIEGRSSFTTGLENFTAGTYSYIFTTSPCPAPFIATHPGLALVRCDSTARFTVATAPPAGPYTFQWRRNGVPLTNSSHIAGATSSTLTISHACYPDTGAYDVVVSSGSGGGTISEPSQVARLDITTGTVAVDPALRAPHSLAIALAGPSPFVREASFRYQSPDARPATITIHDITGARIRHLGDRLNAGTGTVTWDGRTSAGVLAPAGVYFLRIEAGDMGGSCRVVRLR